MTQHELATMVRARFAHHLEMNGTGANPASVIRRIANEIAHGQHGMRGQIEDILLDEWAQMSAEEGESDDYLA